MQTVYGIMDVHLMWEVVMVDLHNQAILNERNKDR